MTDTENRARKTLVPRVACNILEQVNLLLHAKCVIVDALALCAPHMHKQLQLERWSIKLPLLQQNRRTTQHLAKIGALHMQPALSAEKYANLMYSAAESHVISAFKWLSLVREILPLTAAVVIIIDS